MEHPPETKETILDPQRAVIRLPLWSVITGSLTLVWIGIVVAWLAANVRDSIIGNQITNNSNAKMQMEATETQTMFLKQIACQTKWPLYNSERSSKYRGECERI